MPNRPHDQPAKDVYVLLDELDRLEELIEDMDDLGVSSRAEAEKRMAELDAEVDALSPGSRDDAEA